MSDVTLRECVLAAADAVESARDELCRLDAVAGDGDHGLTMAFATRAIRRQLEEYPDATGADLVTRVAFAMGSVGGAIGPIYATALVRTAATIRSFGDADQPSPTRARECAEAAFAAISDLGNATPGDKTVLDALLPVVEAFRAGESSGADLGPVLASAALAAREGAASTAGMVATVGRASRLGERSRGSADPGATSLSIIVEAISTAYREGSG
jgi:dihydroxyacetone kinase phosphoprotein-dependent L subunit